MPDKVFIGSTGQDLKEYRQAAIEVCNQLSLVPIAMEFFEAMGAGATKGCRQKVDEADLYVGIFAHRYGYIEEGHEKSVTEDEFDYAGERELDRLCYLVDPKHDWPPDSIDFEQYDKLKAFKARIDKSVIREEFTSVDDFQAKLTRALVAWKEKQEGYRRGVIETRKNAEEAARLREIESKDRAARIFRRWAAVATVWGVIAAGAGVLAYQNSQLAFSRELAAASTLNLESDPELSVRLALHAIQEVPETDEARTALHQALMSSRVRFTLQGGRVLNTVAFSHDGSRLAAAGEAQHVELWDTETQEKRQCCEHGGTVHAVAFSPDGSRLATASANEDQTAKVWNTHSGEQLLTLSGHQEQISDVAFSPDGTRLATASADGTVKLWEAASGENTASLDHGAPVNAVAFDTDGKRLATAGDDNFARLWDLTGSQPKLLRKLEGHEEPIYHVAFSPDAKRLATAGEDNSARVWDADGQQVLLLEVSTNGMTGVAFSPDGAYLATSVQDNTAIIWDANTGQQVRKLLGHTNWLTAVAYKAKGRRLATASLDGTAKVWDVSPDAGYAGFSTDGLGNVDDIAFGADGRVLAVGSTDDDNDMAKVWDVQTGKERQSFAHLAGQGAEMIFGPKGGRVSALGSNGVMTLWDSSSQQVKRALSGLRVR